jgi:hypothetical protein
VQRPVGHLPAEEIHEDAQTAEEDGEPQVEVLEDPREDHSVLFEIEQAVDVPALQLAVGEIEPRVAPAIEIGELSILGPLVDESGARRRGNRGEGPSFVAQLDIEVAGVGLLVFASGAGVFHDEARHRPRRSQVHLQEQRKALSAPPVGLTSSHAAVDRLLRRLILAARRTSSDGTVEREIDAAIRPVDLELVNPGHRLPAVRRTGDIQADEAGVDRRLDDVSRCPCIPGAWPDAADPHP